MTSIRFRREAEHDLRAIIAHYQGVAPDILPAITDDIFRSIDLLTDFPAIGMGVEGRAFRRIVTRRYRFQIAYMSEPGFITILGIFRFQDRER
ncbi:type II toxin-antitoxin system RelE/ParE family toxin [Pelagerythrobacter sp.]|uniref:type II toxin-antitoxin system RelE/ParE family toxin n=1 Tax=Pelagerythrobacter sp. TaxID=2800702 RepID=UPI0035B24FC8